MNAPKERSTGKMLWQSQGFCDGDWEHNHEIAIGNIDNPGWILDVDLKGTDLENAPFEDYKENYDNDRDWVTCGLQDGRFVCNGGPLKLERMMEIFLDWAESTAPVAPTDSGSQTD